MGAPLIAANRPLLTWAAVVAIAGIALQPYFGGTYMTMLLAQAFLYAVAAISLDLVWGYAGIPEMGHSLWFGIGALSVGSMTTTLSDNGTVLKAGGPIETYLEAIGLGVGIAAALAAVMAWYAFSRRSSHFYIAVVGLALASVAPPLYSQFPMFSGGENGLFGFAYDAISDLAWYYLSASTFVVITGLALVFVRSDFGVLMRAVRDNESRVRYLGFNVEAVKIAIYALGAAIAALAGALFACMTGAVSAPLFGFLFATEMLVWVAVGGRGTILGPAIGTILLCLLGSKLNASFPSEWGLILGALFVFVVVFMPNGILPALVNQLRRLMPTQDTSQRRDRLLVPEPAGAQTFVPGRPAIEIKNLTFSYGRLHVLRGIDLTVQSGELLCIVGPNGAGKSTLIGVLTDGDQSFGGQVDFHLNSKLKHRGRPPHRIARRGVARKFQVPSLCRSLTVAEHILLADAAGRWPSVWRHSHAVRIPGSVKAICNATGIGTKEDMPADTLAHGLKQGLEIAIAVAARPQVVFMDEPTAGLTINERAVVGDILRKLVQDGLTVVLIEHDLDFVEEVADRLAVLHDGRVIQTGTAREVTGSSIVREAYLGSFEMDEPRALGGRA